MSNTKVIQNTKTISLPKFPVLTVRKTKRVMTKHMTNLSLWLPSAELELLSFLVYECMADNTFEYSTRLLEKFGAAHKAVNEQYDNEFDFEIFYTGKNLTQSRATLKSLIERGLILQSGKKNVLMINPALTYSSSEINNKEYKEFMEYYNSGATPEKVVEKFSSLVSKFLESKKPNYEYRRRKKTT